MVSTSGLRDVVETKPSAFRYYNWAPAPASPDQLPELYVIPENQH
jgi:hypothetical protein